jgi:hypothetical protein
MIDGMLHPVTILMARADFTRYGGFDEAMAGYEDWEFMAKLAYHAACGIRVPRPLLAYRIHTGTQRKIGQGAREERARLIHERYGALDMAKRCCGGNGDALIAARNALTGYPAGGATSGPDGDCPAGQMTMEYIGTYLAPVTFLGKYKGGRANHQFACVAENDISKLERTGHWRKSVAAVSMDHAPEPRVVIVEEAVQEKIRRAEAIERIQDARRAAEEAMVQLRQEPVPMVSHPVGRAEDQPETTLTVASTNGSSGETYTVVQAEDKPRPKRSRKS